MNVNNYQHFIFNKNNYTIECPTCRKKHTITNPNILNNNTIKKKKSSTVSTNNTDNPYFNNLEIFSSSLDNLAKITVVNIKKLKHDIKNNIGDIKSKKEKLKKLRVFVMN